MDEPQYPAVPRVLVHELKTEKRRAERCSVIIIVLHSGMYSAEPSHFYWFRSVPPRIHSNSGTCTEIAWQMEPQADMNIITERATFTQRNTQCSNAIEINSNESRFSVAKEAKNVSQRLVDQRIQL